jgi:hypothetical protein
MAIPLVISLIFGMVFSPSGEQKLPRFKLLVVDRDDTFVSQFVKSSFTQGELAEMIELQEVSPEEGYNMMDGGKATALLDIPEGFGDDLLEGKSVQLRLVKNPAQELLPDIAEKITEIVALLLDYGSRILSDPINEIKNSEEESGFPDEEEWIRVGKLFYTRLEKIQEYALPPVIELETEVIDDDTEEEADMNFFALFLPGIALMSLLFIAEVAFRDLAIENEGGQLKRIFVTPTGPFGILMGKLAYAFTLVYISFLIMAVSGILLFGITLEDPLLFFTGGALSSIACTGVMGLVYSMIGEEKRGGAVTSIIVIVMCMIGGSFLPLQAFPEFWKGLARFTLNYWCIDLLQEAIWSGFTNGGGVVINILVLSLITAVTVSLSVIMLHRKMIRGIIS